MTMAETLAEALTVATATATATAAAAAVAAAAAAAAAAEEEEEEEAAAEGRVPLSDGERALAAAREAVARVLAEED